MTSKFVVLVSVSLVDYYYYYKSCASSSFPWWTSRGAINSYSVGSASSSLKINLTLSSSSMPFLDYMSYAIDLTSSKYLFTNSHFGLSGMQNKQ